MAPPGFKTQPVGHTGLPEEERAKKHEEKRDSRLDFLLRPHHGETEGKEKKLKHLKSQMIIQQYFHPAPPTSKTHLIEYMNT